MSQMLQICHGTFGRAAVLDLDASLVEHAHSYSHLLFWLDGEYNCLDVNGKMVDLDQDHAVAVNSWEPHSVPIIGRQKQTLFLLLYLKPDWLFDQCVRIGVIPKFCGTSFPYTQEMQELVQRLVGHIVGENSNFSHNIEQDIANLVEQSTLAMYRGTQDDRVPISTRNRSDLRIRKSLEYMNSHLDTRPKFADVARAACISRPHFFTLFRKHMRMTPNVYWNTVRMESAIEQLVLSDISLTDLSANLGFSEHANFSRFFRNHSGVCPSQYRLVSGGGSHSSVHDFRNSP